MLEIIKRFALQVGPPASIIYRDGMPAKKMTPKLHATQAPEASETNQLTSWNARKESASGIHAPKGPEKFEINQLTRQDARKNIDTPNPRSKIS